MLGVSPLSPRLLEAFALSRLEVGLLLPAVYIGGFVFALPGGYLADRVGVRAAFVGGLLITGGPLVGAALAPSFLVFLELPGGHISLIAGRGASVNSG